MILERLGVFGWKERDEDVALASLLTGDPLLLIGNHGCAKTLIANKLAEALGKEFLVYDASKAMFEDVLGYPNIEKLKQGTVEYVPSKVTVWDKEFILIDELNRAIPELQSKWLEIIRSRKIMGIPTKVKWVWSAMNPMSYSATQALDEALIGRFALFVYPPDVLSMSEDDRIKVTMHINGEDAPGLGEWCPEVNTKTVMKDTVSKLGDGLNKMFGIAARHFNRLRCELPSLSEFLARFADLLMRETKGEVSLDGRRLGFIYRNILAVRAVELAKAEVFATETGLFEASARYAVQSSVPVGLNDESVKREETLHKVEICFDLLSTYFQQGSEMAKVTLIYELFTTQDLMRKAEILLTSDLGEMAASKAWNDLINGDADITILAYTALQVEARRPGTVPRELLESLSKKVNGCSLSSGMIPALHGEHIEYIEEIEALLDQKTDLAKLVAYNHIRALAMKEKLFLKDVKHVERLIQKDVAAFEALILRGGCRGDVQAVA